MPVIYRDVENVSSNFSAAVGSRVGASPITEILMFKRTLTVNGTWWNTGTLGSLVVSAGTLLLGTSAAGTYSPAGTWDSQIYNYELPQAYVARTARANVNGAGSISYWARVGDSVAAVQGASWQEGTPGQPLQLPHGAMIQHRLVLYASANKNVTPLVENLNTEQWYSPRRDPRTQQLATGDLDRGIERLMNEFSVGQSSGRFGNDQGWWNYDGKLNQLNGTVFDTMARDTSTKGTAGTYRGYAYQNPLNPNGTRYPNSFLEPSLMHNIQTSNGGYVAREGTWVGTWGGLNNGTYAVPTQVGTPTIDGLWPWAGTATMKLTLTTAAPGTTGVLLRGVGNPWNEGNPIGTVAGNASVYLYVGSSSGNPTIRLAVTWQLKYLNNVVGTHAYYGSTHIATLPTGSLTRFEIPYKVADPDFVAANNSPILEILKMEPNTYVELYVAGPQDTHINPLFDGLGTYYGDLRGTTLVDFRPGTYIPEVIFRGATAYQRGGALAGVTLTSPGTTDGQVTELVLGPFFSSRNVFNEEVAIWGGYRLGWTGGTWGTEELVPFFRGNVDGFRYDGGQDVTLPFRDQLKKLTLATAEKVTQTNAAGGAFWTSKRLDFLLDQLLTQSSGIGTNTFGTRNQRVVDPTELGTVNTLLGTFGVATPVGTGLSRVACSAGTGVNGTAYFGVANTLYALRGTETTFTTLGTTPVAGAQIVELYAPMKHVSGAMCVGMTVRNSVAGGLGGPWHIMAYDEGTGIVKNRQIGTTTLGGTEWSHYASGWPLVSVGVPGLYHTDAIVDAGGTRFVWGFTNFTTHSFAAVGTITAQYTGGIPHTALRHAQAAYGTVNAGGTYFLTAYDKLLNLTTGGTVKQLSGGGGIEFVPGNLNAHRTATELCGWYTLLGTAYLWHWSEAEGTFYDSFERVPGGTSTNMHPWYQEQDFPYRAFSMDANGRVVSYDWYGTATPVTTLTNVGTGGQVFGLEIPTGTTRYLAGYQGAGGAVGTAYARSAYDFVTPLVGTANFGPTPVSTLVGELAESLAFLTYLDVHGRFLFRRREGTNTTLATYTASDILETPKISYSETQPLSPLMNSLTYGFLGQGGTTVLTAPASIGTYGTHNFQLTNRWMDDFNDNIKKSVMTEYLNRYQYPKRVMDVTVRYDPRRELDDQVAFSYPYLNLAPQTWRILRLRHSLTAPRSYLTVREV